MSYSFEAEPRVVHSRAKYKENVDNSAHKNTFTQLINDPKIKVMDPVNQELEYIKLERERIKIENMHNQLLNFKKVKKKMTPYDIKPSPNPRIDVQLEFFLTDAHNIPPKKVNCDTQTDEFYNRPPSPEYIPKKTGIDEETQVEDNELFDFDREVKPIVNVVVTKTIEQSILEIEEEEEIENMSVFKQEFKQRRENQKKKEKTVENKEIEFVKKKEKEKNSLKSYGFKRVQTFNIVHNYLRNLKENTLESVFCQGLYQDDLENQIKIQFFDWLCEETIKEFNKMESYDNKTENVISKFELGPEVMQIRKPFDSKIQKIKFNQVNRDKRMIRLFYSNPNTQQSYFRKNFNRFLDGTLEEYEVNYKEKIATWTAQVENNEITEEEMQNLKANEFPEAGVEFWGVYFKRLDKIAFTLSHNMYYPYKPEEKQFEINCLMFDDNFSIVDNFGIGKEKSKHIKYMENLFDPKSKISDNEAIVINFNALPSEITSILLYAKHSNLQDLITTRLNDINYSRYSLKDFRYNFLLNSTDFNFTVDFESKVEEQQEFPNEEARLRSYKGLNRAFALNEFDLTKPQEDLETQLKQIIEKEDSDLLNSAMWGSEFHILTLPPKDVMQADPDNPEGEPIAVSVVNTLMNRPPQLRRVGKLGDIEWRINPEPIQEPEELEIEGEGEGGEEEGSQKDEGD